MNSHILDELRNASRTLYPSIVARIPVFLRRRISATDVLQVALINTWKIMTNAKRSHSSPGSLFRFLAFQELSREYRANAAKKRGGSFLDSGEPVDSLIDPRASHSALECAIDAEDCHLVRQSMSELNATDRDLLRRRFIEGQTLIEIARQLGLSESAAKQRINTAKKRLKVILVLKRIPYAHS